jgi:hypothetical protein
VLTDVVVLVEEVVVVGGVYDPDTDCNTANPPTTTVETTTAPVDTSLADSSILRFAPDASTPPVSDTAASPNNWIVVAKPTSLRTG